MHRTGLLPSAGGYGRYQWKIVSRSNVGDLATLVPRSPLISTI